MRALRCDNCGAVAEPAATRCVYCGAVPEACDVIASGFGGGATAWEVTPPVPLTQIDVDDERRALRVELASLAEVPGPTMACAWTRDDFVDVDISAAIAFDQPHDGLGAGFWLRSDGDHGVWVMLHHDGSVTAVTRAAAGRQPLATIARLGVLRPGAPTLLRARLVRDVLSVTIDGVPRGSWTCSFAGAGGAMLFVQVAKTERAVIRFVDASVRLA